MDIQTTPPNHAEGTLTMLEVPKPPLAIKSYNELKNSLPAYMTNPTCRRWLLHINKVPHYTNHKKRSGKLDILNDWDRLASFDEAYAIFATGKYTGLGFALGPDGKGGYWQGIDLDDWLNHPHLWKLKLPGYVELSPSGNGYHAIGYGRHFLKLSSNDTGTEADSHGKYYTVTGNTCNEALGFPLTTTPIDIADFVEQILRPIHSVGNKKKIDIAGSIEPKTVITLPQETMEDLSSALSKISADNYHTWVAVGQALRWIEGGFELWASWSTISSKFKEEDLTKWDGFKGDHTAYKAIFALAQRYGWHNPRRILPDPTTVGFGTHTQLLGLPAQPLSNTQSPTPLSLPELPPVHLFDYSYLPEALRDFVYDISNRMQSPPDFVAVGAYVMLSTVIGRKIGIRPKKLDDWTVTPNLWAAAIGHSGVKKSPALKESLAPLRKLEAKAYNEFNKQMSEYEDQCELAQINQALNKSEAKKAVKNKNLTEAKNWLKQNQINDKPTLKRYITNDASYEALGELMIENPNGVTLFSDELIGLLKRLDTPGQESARAFYLTAADGNQSYTFDRITRGKNLRIKVVCASIVGGIQPGVISEYVRQATDGGSGADGLLQRFGLMVYPDISSNYEPVDREPNLIARAKVSQLIEKLDCLNPSEVGAESDTDDGMPFLRLEEPAQILFSEWDTKLQRRLRSGEEHPAMVSHLSKYPKLILSLALLNHLCDSKSGAVSKVALERAISYGAYLESHARRVYSFAARPEIEAAITLLKRLTNQKLSTPFTAREVSQKGWAGLSTAAKTQTAIDVLLEYGHLTEEEKRESVGRPTKLYHWNKKE